MDVIPVGVLNGIVNPCILVFFTIFIVFIFSDSDSNVCDIN